MQRTTYVVAAGCARCEILVGERPMVNEPTSEATLQWLVDNHNPDKGILSMETGRQLALEILDQRTEILELRKRVKQACDSSETEGLRRTIVGLNETVEQLRATINHINQQWEDSNRSYIHTIKAICARNERQSECLKAIERALQELADKCRPPRRG